MKKTILTFILIIIVCFNISSQWQTYNVTTALKFYDVSVVNQNVIWACGDSAKVYRTTNGGINWQLVNNGLPSNSIYQISAIDQNSVWLNFGERIFASTNGGMNWSEQFYNPVNFINAIKFFNANTGYILTDWTDSIVGFFVTRNGGLNWIRSANSPVVINSTSMWVNDNGVSSLDSNFIYFIIEGLPAVYSRFYKLTGGLNNPWQYYNIGGTPGQYSYSSFKNTNTGLVTFSNGISITTNGGVNWQVRDNTSFLGVYRELMIVPGTDWVVQTSNGNIRISYDLCNTWKPVTPFSGLNFCDAKDTNSIWVAASNGKLLKYNFTYIGIIQLSTEVPDKFILYQNYPNPFNPVTIIKFDVPKSGIINFKVYDVLGKVIYSLNENKDAGTYEIAFDGNEFASGIYYYSIETNGLKDVKKMILLK